MMGIGIEQLIELDKAIDFVVDYLAPATKQTIFVGYANYFHEAGFKSKKIDLINYCKQSKNLKVLIPLMERWARKQINYENDKARRIKKIGRHPRPLRTPSKPTGQMETQVSNVV